MTPLLLIWVCSSTMPAPSELAETSLCSTLPVFFRLRNPALVDITGGASLAQGSIMLTSSAAVLCKGGQRGQRGQGKKHQQKSGY